MRSTALILAAHGSRTDSGVCAELRALADGIAARGIFAEVSIAFHHGRPGFGGVLDGLTSPRAIVVPVMAADGYYCHEVLPRELARNACLAHMDVGIAPPIGVHPRMAVLVKRRAVELITRYRLRPEATTLVVVGHGTPRSARSSASTHAIVEHLRAAGVCDDVLPAFLDEPPSPAAVASSARHRELLAVPFLISNGPHVVRDIPAAFGLALRADDLPPLARGVGDRWIVCDRAVGADPEIAEIIVDSAMDYIETSRRRSFEPESNGQQATGGTRGVVQSFNRPGLSKRSSRTAPAIASTNSSLVPVGSGPLRRSAASTYRLGTRVSRMARWQAELVAEGLRARGAEVQIVELSTCGDRDLSRAISDLPGASPFADDIELALLRGEIDLAVHCLKDLPTSPTPGLTLAAVLPRQDVREALVSRDDRPLAGLPPGAVVGTSSVRREAQLLHLRPDVRVAPIRGPVESRVRQVRAGDFDAAILALAGLERLGLSHEACEVFEPDVFMPAPGQGALVVQVRSDDGRSIGAAAGLDHTPTRLATQAEWALQLLFDGDASVTPATWAVCRDGLIEMTARLIARDGSKCRDARASGAQPAIVAEEVCAILNQCRDREEAVDSLAVSRRPIRDDSACRPRF